jgi:hypothetical protein
LVVAEQAPDQLRVERRVLCGGEREPAGIDRHEKPIDAFFDIGSTIETRRTNRRRPGRRLAPKRPTGHAALNAQLGHLKADAVALRRRCEMHATVEPHAEHGNATFASRAAGGQRCWRTAIRLRGVNVADSCPHFCSHGFLGETTADRRTTIEIASIVKKGSKQGSRGMITLVDVKTEDHGGSGWTISGRLDCRRQNGR